MGVSKSNCHTVTTVTLGGFVWCARRGEFPCFHGVPSSLSKPLPERRAAGLDVASDGGQIHEAVQFVVEGQRRCLLGGQDEGDDAVLPLGGASQCAVLRGAEQHAAMWSVAGWLVDDVHGHVEQAADGNVRDVALAGSDADGL